MNGKNRFILINNNVLKAYGSGSEGNDLDRTENHVSKSSLSKLPELSALPEEEEEQVTDQKYKKCMFSSNLQSNQRQIWGNL